MRQAGMNGLARASVAGWLALTLSGAAADSCSTPLPSDVATPAAPSADGPGAFLGTWGDGKWQGVLCHTLVVESVGADNTATAVYSHGVHQAWNIRAPGFRRMAGTIRNDVLYLEFPNNGPRVEYRIVDGRLHGKYTIRQNEAFVVLTRK
jgi:hypothetical protein